MTTDAQPDQHADPAPGQGVRSRYHHTCGQMIWVVTMPQGPLYYAKLLPTLPPPITHCPGCGQALEPEALTRRRDDHR
jgi:hypothetical protein